VNSYNVNNYDINSMIESNNYIFILFSDNSNDESKIQTNISNLNITSELYQKLVINKKKIIKNKPGTSVTHKESKEPKEPKKSQEYNNEL